MLKLRIITALVLIPVFTGAVWFLNTPTFALLMSLVIAQGAWEWSGLSKDRDILPRALYVMMTLGVLSLLYFYQSQTLVYVIMLLMLGWWLIALLQIVRFQKSGQYILQMPLLLTGLLVLAPAWFCLIQLHDKEPQGPQLVLFVLILIWSADIAAYFSGRRWGRKKLASQVSPGKSWEGVYGALCAAVLIGLAYAVIEKYEGLNIVFFILISIITVAASILGDLLESLLKRRSDRKDSGSLLPGHGGVLDRIDSLTAALPIFFCSMSLWEKAM